MKRLLIILLFFVLPVSSYAWDATGHQLVAQIAYQHLRPSVKHKVDRLVHELDHDYAKTNFVKASAWADVIKGHDVSAFNDWHFIDLYFSDSGMPLPKVPEINAVWAIKKAMQVEQSLRSNRFEKAFFLRFLIHIVGDIHQPLHCTARVTPQYPEGDQGGNLYPIIYPPYNNLHSFWDQGAGFFAKDFPNYPLTKRQVRRLAHAIQKHYPPSHFGAKVWDLDPQSWAQQSFRIARTWVYHTPEHKKPNRRYTQRSQRIVERQIALAGYRLANLLNQLFA